MPKNSPDGVRVLTGNWSAPAAQATGEAGRPLVCVASTYTFHADFFESELLPRFLGLKFDDTESVRPFVVEREQALATARVCVLVDADHFDPSQSTLRWDQLPVRVPGGAQHSKVAVLLWENCARLIVSSANVTRQGYRRNREMVGVVDFFDHESSAPRRLLLDAIAFLQDMNGWVRASDTAKGRLRQALDDVRARVRAWRQMPADFRPLERPRATFVAGLPKSKTSLARSPIEQLLLLWGTRRADEITVMTPFVGDLAGPVDPVVRKFLELPRTRDVTGYLVVPGCLSEADPKRMTVGLPRRFLEAWASEWHVDPNDVPTYVVPLCRSGEKANRDLHAKGILVGGEGVTMLLCGSSNFSPHGMGVGVANAEANICYLDDHDARRNGLLLEDRLPADWEKDLCKGAIWPETAELIEDEDPGADRPLPAAFLCAVYNQQTATLIVVVDATASFPSEWSLRWPGERSGEAPPLVDHVQQPHPPTNGHIVLQLPASLRGANIAGLRLHWRDGDGAMQRGILAVHVESAENLLPPEEFRSLTSDGILQCLLSGRELAEWLEALEWRKTSAQTNTPPRELDSLLAVETSGYVLFRTRRLGQALAELGERLVGTVRMRDAMAYRLGQDPLGPLMLAKALVREWQAASAQRVPLVDNPSVLLFGLAEINLMVAHVARTVTESHLRPLFRTTIDDIDGLCKEVASGSTLPPNLATYIRAVKRKADDLLRPRGGGYHAR